MSDYNFNTKVIHAGQKADPITGAVTTPISLSTTFRQKSPGELSSGFEYSRTGNPTRNTLEDCLAALENGKWGVCFSSGLAATASLVNIFQNGDEVVCMDDVYGGTRRYFSKIAGPMGLGVKYVDFTDAKALEAAISPKTKFLWLETPTNPTLKISDIEECSKIAKRHDVLLVVDNTFMSSYFQRPLDLGADLVVHSITKYLNGHCDVVMGVICGRDDSLRQRLKYVQNGMGAVPSPFDCFLVLRGLKTLAVRMQRHEENAKVVANFLESHPKVEKVLYPGLPSHPQHELAKKQQKGFGGMITFYIKGGLVESRQFLENVKIFALAESLGGVESLIEHPAIMTHASVPVEERAKLGISDSLIRLSVGIEDVQDLLADLKNGFDHVVSDKQ
eukprot:TRINITY_DN9706_c0_g1_i1.p1 TRINITY_DN9706_c0_g1~~TRINITY_DN9706_c0_g1_i1.p1  ORF type:complete len:390 (-),score=89.94 TRINITY_DN9706_c0_g1_i1:40-1209(-)